MRPTLLAFQGKPTLDLEIKMSLNWFFVPHDKKLKNHFAYEPKLISTAHSELETLESEKNNIRKLENIRQFLCLFYVFKVHIYFFFPGNINIDISKHAKRKKEIMLPLTKETKARDAYNLLNL